MPAGGIFVVLCPSNTDNARPTEHTHTGKTTVAFRCIICMLIFTENAASEMWLLRRNHSLSKFMKMIKSHGGTLCTRHAVIIVFHGQ